MQDKTGRSLVQKFKGFCKGLGEKDNVIIFHHSDADGFCSALVAGKAVEKLSGKKPVAIQPYEYGNRAQVRSAKAKARKANTLLVLDIGIDSTPELLEEIGKFEKCLVLDHHKLYKDLNSEKALFLKPQFLSDREPSSYVTSKFAFDLFSNVTELNELDWIACIGILGDMALPQWKEFVQETISKRNVSLTWLYRFVDLIAAVEVLASAKLPELYWEFYNAKTPGEVLENRFSPLLKEFKEEKDSMVEGFKDKAEVYPKLELYFYAIRSRHENIKSYVINEISELHPNKTIILTQYLGTGRIRFSARRQDSMVRVNDLLLEAIKGIPNSNAGGHAPAAAGSIPKQFLSRFKKNVIGILESKS